MENIFNKKFWINHWENDRAGDTSEVHKGFSTSRYWDKASLSYNRDEGEIKSRRLDKTISCFKTSQLLFEGMRVLDIGCGTGMLSIELAKHGAQVVALDFSRGMLERFKADTPSKIKDNIQILHEDWFAVDIEKNKWENAFDLVIAFMSPGVSTPEAFFKMMECSRNGCAIRGWASKSSSPIVAELWKKIMGSPLKDKPQSILYKINLLFSMGYFPEITFDTIHWDQMVSFQDEYDRQVAFFQKVSDLPLEKIKKVVHDHLEPVSDNNMILRQQQGLTATAVWKIPERRTSG